MSLSDLRDILQEQVDARQAFTVSAGTLTRAGLTPRASFDSLVRAHLDLGEGDLTVGYAGEVPAPGAGSLTVTGTAGLLGVTAAPVTVTFLDAGGVADARVAVGLPAGWTPGTAFPSLDREPFSGLALTDAWYVLSTAPSGSFAWNGGTHPLVQGSQFFSMVSLTGPL